MEASPGRSYRWLFWFLAIGGLAADQTSKYGIFAYLYDPETLRGQIEVFSGETKIFGHTVACDFHIVASYSPERETGSGFLAWLRTLSAEHLPYVNQGALFGTTLALSPKTSNLVFALISVLAAGGIVYWSTRASAGRDGVLCAALGLILAGTLGNLYDRTIFGGVRDFLHFFNLPLPFGLDNWPVFNIADICLVCGAGLLLVEAVFARHETEPTADASPATELAVVENAAH